MVQNPAKAADLHLVTGPAALPYAEVADTLARAAGRPVRYVDLSDAQLKAGLLSSGQPEWQATALVELNAYARQGHASTVTDTVERLTGRPATTLRQFAEDHAAAFRA